jgi:predicted RecA/RadA family phage recombinase
MNNQDNLKTLLLKTKSPVAEGDIIPLGDLMLVVAIKQDESCVTVFEGPLEVKKTRGVALQAGQSVWVDIGNLKDGILGLNSIGASMAQGLRMVGFALDVANPDDPKAPVYWDGKITTSVRVGGRPPK